MKKIYGFTLSETLITLGVIGVVAALTLPTLIKNFQMKAYETAFKKEYSAIQNTLNYLAAEENLTECYVYFYLPTNGDGQYGAISSDCAEIWQGLAKNLHMTSISQVSNYTKKSEVVANGGSMVNPSVDYNLILDNHSYMLPDGAIVGFSKATSSYTAPTILLDVNGKKGPNKWGYDVFYLTLSQHSGSKNLRLGDEYASIIEKGGKYPRTILKNSDTNTGGWYWN
jgi:prepilin-type N-terminal cleavage/methylation domain-containing protein